MTEQQYPDWRAIDQAIKAAAKQAQTEAGPSSLTLNDVMLQARFDRFLCRVFADSSDGGWLLKGGTGMLARVRQARRTQDVDLVAHADSIGDAVADLRERASADMGDHLRFTLERERAGGGDAQPDVETRSLTFACWAGARRVGEVKVDVVVEPAPTAPVDIVEPVTRLHLGRPLQTVPYRLYPIADHVADKVCATMSTFGAGNPSTRVKDLVDLVAIARTQDVDLRQLQLAIATGRRRRRLEAFDHLQVPEAWRSQYRQLAAKTPLVADTSDLDDALALVDDFLGPALREEPISRDLVWRPQQGWSDVDAPTLGAGGESGAGSGTAALSGGDVYVPPHTRNGRPVAGHWRRKGIR